MRFLLKQNETLSKNGKISLLAWKSQRVLLEERNNLIKQILAITHLEPITETMFRTLITLNVNFSAFEEIAEFIENYTVLSFELEAETWFYLSSSALRLIEMNGKATLTVNKPKHIISGQHQVSPFR